MRLFGALVVVFWIVGVVPALACSCSIDSYNEGSSARNIARAKYIVQGSVSFVAPGDAEKEGKYKGQTAFGVTPEKIMKGEQIAMLSAYADTTSKCGVSVEALKRMDFFVLYEEEGELHLATVCNNYIAPEHRLALMRGKYAPPTTELKQ